MKVFIVVVALFGALALADEDYCFQDASGACNSPSTKAPQGAIASCNAKYGDIDGVQSDLQAYANAHIARSFDYLLMSTHYANYKKNRLGFEKLFREMSDKAWGKGIDLIKHITKRGGVMNFHNIKPESVNTRDQPYEVSELQSLAKALDMEKTLAKEAIAIHREVSAHNKKAHDPEITNYLEEEFMEGQAETIRKLAGYTSDLNKLVFSPDASLALYMFDEMLQK